MTGHAPRILCVGEALVALTPVEGTLRTAHEVSVTTAGAELNVAVHLARLGVRARFAGRVGDDPFGQRVRDVLVAEGVDVRHLVIDPHRPTGLYAKDPGATRTAVHYYRSGSAAAHMEDVPAEAFEEVAMLHLTGITPALSPACASLVQRLVDGRACPVAFDVNHRPALWTAAEAAGPLLDLARRADIVFVGLDEAQTLWGVHSPDDVRELLPGVPEVVVKDSGRQASTWTAEGRADVPALPVEVVEPVGAGDAFAAGYLAARVVGRDVQAALRQGHVVAAAVLGALSDHGAGVDDEALEAAATGTGWPVVRRSPEA